MPETEFFCPACHAVADAKATHCVLCGAPLTHVGVRTVKRDPIFPEPILVRHADRDPAFPMDSTAHMEENCAPVAAQFVQVHNEKEQVIDLATRVRACTRYLILGGGIAALTAAESIRSSDASGEIVMLSGESRLPYRRPRLARQLGRNADFPAVALRTEEDFAAANITVHTDCPAERIDAAAHLVFCPQGAISYDKCILALGSTPKSTPLAGVGVYTLHDFADIEDFPHAEHVLVIGGGLCGIEAAVALAQHGKTVTLTEAEPTLLPRMLHRTTAAQLARKLRALGITVLTDTYCEQSAKGADGVHVMASNGKRLVADAVLLTNGRVPKDLVGGAARDVGFLVNANMETSLPDVYACGDCVQFADGTPCMGWQFAVESGEIAGARAAGKDACYTARPHPVLLELGDCALCMVGDCGASTARAYRIVSYGETDSRAFAEYFFADGKLVGAATIAKKPDITLLTDAVARGLSESAFFATHAFCATGHESFV